MSGVLESTGLRRAAGDDGGEAATVTETFDGRSGLAELSSDREFSAYDGSDGFRATRLTVPLGVASLQVLRATPCRVSRNRARINSVPDDSFILNFVRRGDLIGNQDARSINARTNAVFFLRSGRPYHYAAVRGIDLVSLSIPVSSLRTVVIGQANRITALSLEQSASLRAAAAYTQALLETAFDLDGVERSQIGRVAVQLVMSTISSTPLSTSPEQSSRDGILDLLYGEARALIDDNLREPRLSAGWLAASLRVNQRRLQRAFQAHEDAVERRIREARLDAVAAALASTDRPGEITELFRSHGFANVVTAARSFSARFSAAPRDYAALARR